MPVNAPVVLPLKEIGQKGKEWSLTLHPAHLALAESADERPYVILREQVMKSATLIEGMRAFAINEPRKLSFKLSPEAVTALAEWIGEPVLAAFYLKRRYGWVLPVAIIWILGSLPLPGNPDRNMASVPLDLFGLALGLVLVVSWAFAKWRPHPALFLVDSLWFAAMGVQLVLNVIGGRSKGWLVLVGLLLWLVVTGLRHFVRFRGTRLGRTGAPQS
jgi:hypothetical protein